MPLKGKVETDVELESTPEQFYNLFRRQAHHIPKHTPNNIQGIQVHEGGWEDHGAIRIWKYTIDGKGDQVFKDRVEYDDENKTITFNGLEGDVFKIYKVYKPVWKLVPKGEGGLAICTIEYEKLTPDVPSPDNFLDFMVSITEEVDEGVFNAQ